MNSLEDISYKLMRPARDLADWSFPLSQILEEYYALLEAPENINFGEAALVLQNSTNAYVHRIDCLFHETENFVKQMISSFQTNEDASKKDLGHGHKRNASKNQLDLDNFSLLSLENEVGKNINLKSKNEKVKLISRRFTQLEITGTEMKIPVFDVYGEVIGKKYDFRCNQAVKINGELVDELAPYDFKQNDVTVKEKENRTVSTESSTCSVNVHETETSGYASNQSRLNSTSSNDLAGESPYNSPTGQFSPILENVENGNFEAIDQDEFMEEPSNFGLDTSPNSQEDQLTSPNLISTNRRSARLIEKIRKKETDAEESTNPQQNRIRDKGNVLIEVPDINEKAWKPIPLNQGRRYAGKNVITKNVTKLSGNASLTETKSPSKKRNTASNKAKKRECLTEFILKEIDLSKKRNMNLRRSSAIKPLTKYELEDFEHHFDTCFEKAHEQFDIVQYEPVISGVTMDLLGFRPCLEKNTNSNFYPECDFALLRSPSPDAVDDSGINSIFDESMDDLQNDFSLPDYETLIKDKMKQIFEESDVATELQDTVSKWHEWLKPKLSAAEERPTFRIHDYASHIVRTLQNFEKRRGTFEDVVDGKPACEVARYFLASLQLANTCNVEINSIRNSERSIEIVLLDEETDSND